MWHSETVWPVNEFSENDGIAGGLLPGARLDKSDAAVHQGPDFGGMQR